jgi:hypothetical protein
MNSILTESSTIAPSLTLSDNRTGTRILGVQVDAAVVLGVNFHSGRPQTVGPNEKHLMFAFLLNKFLSRHNLNLQTTIQP